jgi:hypothetical protein
MLSSFIRSLMDSAHQENTSDVSAALSVLHSSLLHMVVDSLPKIHSLHVHTTIVREVLACLSGLVQKGTVNSSMGLQMADCVALLSYFCEKEYVACIFM